jgi:hypothetical protein
MQPEEFAYDFEDGKEGEPGAAQSDSIHRASRPSRTQNAIERRAQQGQ